MIDNMNNRQAGFTLVELSIVVLVISLLVGGILVGRYVLATAEIRSAVNQIEKYKSTVSAFQLKYKYLPGDMPTTQSSQLGFFTLTAGSGTGYQDGNGLIENSLTFLSGEMAIFWRHLSDAGMVDGKFGQNIDASTSILDIPMTSNLMGTAMPALKLGRGNYVSPYPYQGLNTFLLLGFVHAPSGTAAFSPAMSPLEAAEIDRKVDDGFPANGQVIEYINTFGNFYSCVVTSGTVVSYNIGTTTGNNLACGLVMQYGL